MTRSHPQGRQQPWSAPVTRRQRDGCRDSFRSDGRDAGGGFAEAQVTPILEAAYLAKKRHVPRDDVRRAARGQRHDKPQRACRVGLRPCASRDRRERQGARRQLEHSAAR